MMILGLMQGISLSGYARCLCLYDNRLVFHPKSPVAVGLTLDFTHGDQGTSRQDAPWQRINRSLDLTYPFKSTPILGEASTEASLRPFVKPCTARRVSRTARRLAPQSCPGFSSASRTESTKAMSRCINSKAQKTSKDVRLHFQKGERFPRHGNMARIDPRRAVWLPRLRTAIVLEYWGRKSMFQCHRIALEVANSPLKKRERRYGHRSLQCSLSKLSWLQSRRCFRTCITSCGTESVPGKSRACHHISPTFVGSGHNHSSSSAGRSIQVMSWSRWSLSVDKG